MGPRGPPGGDLAPLRDMTPLRDLTSLGDLAPPLAPLAYGRRNIYSPPKRMIIYDHT